MMTRVASISLMAATAFALGCATPGEEPERRALTDPAKLATARTLEGVALSDAGWPQGEWWGALGDPQLKRLIATALAGNPSLAIAQARLDRTKAGVLLAESALRPEAIGSLDMTYQRFSAGNAIGASAGDWRWQNRLALDLSWELDFWGKNRASLRAALGQLRASEVDVSAARLALTTGIARAYVELNRLHDQADIGRAAVRHREEVLKLTAQRFEAGIDSRVELTQAEAAVPSARADLAAIEESIALTRNLLAALSGEGPDAGLVLDRPGLATASALALPANLPADLIGRRPDLVAQRWRVEAAGRSIEVARAQFYPNVNLIGFIGFSSIGIARFISSSAAIAGVGPAVRLPLFDGGRLRADLVGSRADYDLAVEQYNQTLIDAVREVADQVTSLRALSVRREDQSRALEGFRKAYDLALLRYREGMGNYLQVLDAEVQLLRESRVAADLKSREYDLGIGLVRALGGGYE
jgi:NodT family efflux transporter outer membrane factor (OMF) lipoprotein